MNFNYSVNRNLLLKRLGFYSTKLPTGINQTWTVELPTRLSFVCEESHNVPGGPYVVRLFAHVYSDKRKPHRLYVKCNKCEKWIPFGRFHQHMKVHS